MKTNRVQNQIGYVHAVISDAYHLLETYREQETNVADDLILDALAAELENALSALDKIEFGG